MLGEKVWMPWETPLKSTVAGGSSDKKVKKEGGKLRKIPPRRYNTGKGEKRGLGFWDWK